MIEGDIPLSAFCAVNYVEQLEFLRMYQDKMAAAAQFFSIIRRTWRGTLQFLNKLEGFDTEFHRDIPWCP